MKITKPMLIAALVAGNLFAWNMALRADDSTNTPPAAAKSHGHAFDRMAEQLKLTADQKPQVKTIMDAQTQKLKDLHNDPNFSSLSKEDKHAKMKAISDDTATQLKTVLTPDQFTEWQKLSLHKKKSSSPDAPPQN